MVRTKQKENIMSAIQSTHLFQEIHEQPAAVGQILSDADGSIHTLAKAIRDKAINHVVIAARGTSDNAGRYAKYVLGAFNGLTVALATPSLFTVYQRAPQFGNALVLGISQSGKSPDIVSVLAEAKKQGTLTAAITNEPSSDLAQFADVVLNLGAGVERAVAATKTYTTELATVALLSATLADGNHNLAALQAVPQAMEATLSTSVSIAQIAPRYRYMEGCVVIGRGYNYSTAFEMALKMKELTYTIVEPYSSADFLHGPLALIEHGFPAIVVAPSGVMIPEMKGFIGNLNQRKAETLVISDDESTLKLARIPLSLPVQVPEWLSPLTTIVAGQLFAMHLAHTRDLDIDSPRGIRKVTETR
jgi:glucosamine--fructose-6-phosphate aminotransferase (isomerizing)